MLQSVALPSAPWPMLPDPLLCPLLLACPLTDLLPAAGRGYPCHLCDGCHRLASPGLVNNPRALLQTAYTHLGYFPDAGLMQKTAEVEHRLQAIKTRPQKSGVWSHLSHNETLLVVVIYSVGANTPERVLGGMRGA